MPHQDPDPFHGWRDCVEAKIRKQSPALAERNRWLLFYYHESVLNFLYGDEESSINQSLLVRRLQNIHACYLRAYDAVLHQIDPERFDQIVTAATPMNSLDPAEAICRTLRRLLEDIQILHETHLPSDRKEKHDPGSFLSAALRRCFSMQDHYQVQAYLYATTESLLVIATVRTLVNRLLTQVIDPCTKLNFGCASLLE